MVMPASQVRRDRNPLGYAGDDVVPIRQRRSLPPHQRRAIGKQSVAVKTRRPVDADVLDEEELPMQRMTDDLVEGERTIRSNGKVTPTRSRRWATARVAQFALPRVNKVVLVAALIFAIIVVVGIVTLILYVGDLWTNYTNTLTYGPTRTSVVSGVFGHDNDSLASPTDVIAINVQGTLLIEEVPAGDVSKAKVYPTGLKLVGDNARNVPVILTIQDVNGDHKPDVLIKIPGQSTTLELVNTGTGFTLVTK